MANGDNSVDLTIIIVNWNGGEMLGNCLASIPAAEKHLSVRTIVVDNASRDGSREKAARDFPRFEVINSGANLGFGKANNLVRSRVKSDFVLFLNPDTIVHEDALVGMVECMRSHPDVAILGCKMRYPDGEVHEQGLQMFLNPLTAFLRMAFFSNDTLPWLKRWLPYQDPNQSAYVSTLYGGCMLCRKEVLDKVGWFDERYFMYAEDVDLCRAVIREGWKLYYLGTAEIMHIAGGTTKRAPSGFSVLMMSESIEKLMRKHYGIFGAWFYRVGVLAASLFRLAVLCGLRVVAGLLGRGRDYSGAFFKYRILVLWSLGMKHAEIAR